MKSVILLWRRHPDLNRGIRVLQTHALPLGYVANCSVVSDQWSVVSGFSLHSALIKPLIIQKGLKLVKSS